MAPSAYVPFPSRNASYVCPHRLQEAGHAATASVSVTRLKATATFRSCLPAPDLGLIPVGWVMFMHTRNKHRCALVSGQCSRNAFGMPPPPVDRHRQWRGDPGYGMSPRGGGFAFDDVPADHMPAGDRHQHDRIPMQANTVQMRRAIHLADQRNRRPQAP